MGDINKFKKRGGKTQVRAEERKKRREKKRDETSQRCSVASLAAPAHYTYACTMSAEATTMTMRHIARHLCAVAGAQEATNWMLGNEKFREPASRKKRIFRGTAGRFVDFYGLTEETCAGDHPSALTSVAGAPCASSISTICQI